VAVLELLGGFQAGLQGGGLEGGQERAGAGNGGVDRGAAGAQVAGAASLDHLPGAGAVVAGGGLALALVVDGELAAAGAAGRQALQQRAALADRPGSGLVCHRPDILLDPRLVGEVVLPADVSLLVATARQQTPAKRQAAAPHQSSRQRDQPPGREGFAEGVADLVRQHDELPGSAGRGDRAAGGSC
jgi:hypothetical protein